MKLLLARFVSRIAGFYLQQVGDMERDLARVALFCTVLRDLTRLRTALEQLNR